MLLPNNPAAVINKINNNIIHDYKDAGNPLLLYFLANGRAFYDNLFMSAMLDKVKAENRGESKAKKLQETINVSTIRLDGKVGYYYWQTFFRMT